MTSDTSAVIQTDALAVVASPEQQRRAARMAQEAFAQVFRLTVNADDAERLRGVDELALALRNWSDAAEADASRSLRLALVMSGLDQWGLAYSQAFSLVAIPGLTELLGALRTGLDPQAEANFLQQFAAIDAAESSAIDFKIDLRRGIHLALWHAMISCDDRDQANAILASMGGMMVALVKAMPDLGWRLVADALAHIQIRCLSESLATEGLARDTTESLFASLNTQLPTAHRDSIMAYATQATLQWQQSRRPAAGLTH